MRALNPEDVHPFGGVEYDTLINSMEVEILVQAHDDNYQGDSWYLLSGPQGIGFLTFGWGSCSGCDAAEAVHNVEEATELRDELWASITWHPTLAAMRAWLVERDWSAQFYWRNDTFFGKFLPDALAYISKEN